MKKMPFLLVVLLALATPLKAETASCPDYTALTQAPYLAKPAQKKFRSWWNRWLSGSHRPFHMVHDQIVKEGESATLIGKFDYSSIYHKDLEFEDVHVYLFGSNMNDWQYLGEYQTDRDGKIFVSVNKPEGDYQVRMVVEGDLSETTGFLSVVKPGAPSILFDIDGTLTLNDFEAVGDYLGVDEAQLHAFAAETVQDYIAKGYRIIYLTGRQYWLAKTTREWFDYAGLMPWHLRTDSNAERPLQPETQAYKTAYIRYLLNDVGLNIQRAYGNADTDIAAYADAGLNPDSTYIIGEHAGEQGTQPIYGDYAYHFASVISETPSLGCQPK